MKKVNMRTFLDFSFGCTYICMRATYLELHRMELDELAITIMVQQGSKYTE